MGVLSWTTGKERQFLRLGAMGAAGEEVGALTAKEAKWLLSLVNYVG